MKIIEVFADIWCPFAHVGIRCVVERKEQLKQEDALLYIRAWPLELVNEAPLDSETTAHHVQELREQVAPDLFQHFDPDHFPTTTLPALACVHSAYEKDMKTGEAVSLALRRALFEDGLDISDPGVLEHCPCRGRRIIRRRSTSGQSSLNGTKEKSVASRARRTSFVETPMHSVPLSISSRTEWNISK